MDNQKKSEKPLLSDLDRWRNLADAMSEDALLEQPNVPRFKVKTPAGIKPPLSREANIRIQLARLARNGQSPSERAAQIRAEQYQLEHAYGEKRKDPPTKSHLKAEEDYRRFVASLNESEEKQENTPAAEPASAPNKKSKPRKVK